MTLLRVALGWQHSIFQQCLRRLANRADQKLRQGVEDPGHQLAKTVAAAATLEELDQGNGIVTELLTDLPLDREKGNP